MNGSILLIIFFGFFISAFLGYYIAKQKGRDTTEGILFGLFLGILGLIILGLLPNKSKPENSNSSKEPSQKAIQKAEDNDFFSKLVGYTIVIGIILSVIWVAFNK